MLEIFELDVTNHFYKRICDSSLFAPTKKETVTKEQAKAIQTYSLHFYVPYPV